MSFLKLSCALFSLALLTIACVSLNAAEQKAEKPKFKTIVFADDFSAAKLGKSWRAYKSGSKIEQGILVGLKPKTADHNAVDSVQTKSYSDVEVALDFKFSGSPMFAVAFNEHKFKGTHAGHICRVTVTPKQITLRDGKTGVFNNAIFEMRKAGKQDEKTKALLKTKQAGFKTNFEQGKWYHLLVRIQGDKMTVFIDGKQLGEFKSAGIAHATKNKLALVTAKQAMNFDNLKILVP